MGVHLKEKKEENENAFKHHFNQAFLKRMSDSIAAIYPQFNSKEFLRLMPELKELEMKPRVLRLRDELRNQLPRDFKKALAVLLRSLELKKLNGFDLWPYTEFVQTYGLDHCELSLKTLTEFTKLFTAEWAVRPFIKKHPKETLHFLGECTKDTNVHIRRLASEGTRPRLPWGERLHEFIKDPEPTIRILENLKFDDELYVRKSVANHLNDIAKDNPARVIQVLTQWKKQAEKDQELKIQWIIQRSLRTLIKQGHPGALNLIGVSSEAKIQVTNFKVKQKKIRLGERLEFNFEIGSLAKRPQRLVVDYVVHFMKANKKTAPKVFKLKTFDLLPLGRIHFSKSHHIKKITTREYHPGLHSIEIQVNGAIVGRQNWVLEIK